MDGTEIIREESGSLAWKNFHSIVKRALSGKNSIHSFFLHTEALTAIAAWHKTLVTLINDVIEYFPNGDKDNVPSPDLISHIKIIYNSLTEFEMDFHVFFRISFRMTQIEEQKKNYTNSAPLYIETLKIASLRNSRRTAKRLLRHFAPTSVVESLLANFVRRFCLPPPPSWR